MLRQKIICLPTFFCRIFFGKVAIKKLCRASEKSWHRQEIRHRFPYRFQAPSKCRFRISLMIIGKLSAHLNFRRVMRRKRRGVQRLVKVPELQFWVTECLPEPWQAVTRSALRDREECRVLLSAYDQAPRSLRDRARQGRRAASIYLPGRKEFGP